MIRPHVGMTAAPLPGAAGALWTAAASLDAPRDHHADHPEPDALNWASGGPAGFATYARFRGRGDAPEHTMITAAVAGATPADIAVVAALAARANADQPWAKWLVPDRRQRSDVLRAAYHIVVEHALRYGHVDLLTDRRGAAVWLDRTVASPPPENARERLAAMCRSHAAAASSLVEVIAADLPGYAHLHLAVLATDVDLYAQALLDHRHRRLDLAGVPAYTHADTVDTLTVLEAAGYHPQEPLRLPSGPWVRPMVRPPSSAQGQQAPLWPPDLD